MNTIKKDLFSGVFYTAIAKYSGIVISLLITAVLSRLLTPDDFGIVAVATVIIAFFSIFTDMGLSAAIIQKKELTDNDLSNIFSFTIWTGIGLAFLFFLCSWLIGSYYESELLVILCQLLAVNLFFASATIVPNALFYKNKEFRFIALRTLTIQVICGTIAIVVALLGGGLYALVVNPILSSVLMFLISVKRYPQRLKTTLGLSSIKLIFSYSAYQFLFNIINYFSRNLDKLMIGKYMGMSLLGYYEKSYRLMMLPLQNITQVITPVMHPIFSDYQNDLNQLATSYERIVRMLAFIGIPLTVLLYFTSTELILLLFGDQWLPSIPVFNILALSVGVQVILSSSGSIYQAANDTKSLFICGVFSATLNVLGILAGVFYFKSLTALATCIVITFGINFIQCYWMMYKVTFKRSILPFLKQLSSPLFSGLLLAVILYFTSIAVKDVNFIISLCIKGFLFVMVLALYVQLSKEYDIISKIKEYLNKRKS